ncbi:MAG: sulfatase [Verrucomicrobia bacterium]|nr:sulfatase [Verrucomicrobiota bacterium]
MKTIYRILLLLVFAVAPIHADAAERLPNVVLFLVDDLGWRDLGCYGSPFYETPHIDRFARESVRFTQAYSACHVCSPTRASIMTGKYPATLQMTDWLPGRREHPFQKLKNATIRQHLPFEETTIAEALKEHGYATGHFGKWHLGEEPSGPLRHGFDVQIPRWNRGWPNGGYHAPFRLEGLDDAPGDYLTDRLTDEALKYIEQNKDRQFFLYLSHFAVHDPIQGRADLVSKYQAKLSRSTAGSGPAFILEGNPDAKDPLSRGELDALLQDEVYQGYQVLPRQTVKIKQEQDNVQFAAMVENMDESFGRVMSKLEALGLSDNTIVIFYSDNGGMSAANFGRPDHVVPPSRLDGAYATSNLPLRGAKGWLYEGGIRVPLMVKWPNRGQRGKVNDVPVISADLYPSILEMIGVPARPKQHTDGLSFAGLVRGKKKLDREAIYWHFPHYSNHGMQSPGGAIRHGDYKLLEYFENNTVQLFNLRKDAGEQRDLSREQPKIAKKMTAMLHDWRASVSAAMNEPNPNYKVAQ